MSLFQCLGQGQVTSTKDTNTHEIMVYMPGFFPTAEGRTTTQVDAVETTTENASGEKVITSVMRSNAVPAIWKNIGEGSRITSPDVREGSTVAVYHVLGSNQLYWSTFGVNAETMRLETVMWGWSASPELAENTPFDVDNFYTAKISTHEGIMAFRTSQANGEKSAFDVQIDGMNARISMTGSNKTQFVLDDQEESLTYSNKSKSLLRIEKKKLTVKVDDEINLFGQETIDVKTKTLNIEADLLRADVKLTQWRGEWEHEGNTTQEGDYDQTGDYIQVGDTTRTGDTTSTGTVTGITDVVAPPVSLRLHGHTLVEQGDDVSGPPAL